MKRNLILLSFLLLVVSIFSISLASAEECRTFYIESPRYAIASDTLSNYRAALAIDGNIETHWFGDPNSPYPKTFTADLGKERCINSISLAAFVWDVPIDLMIESSTDDKNWIILVNPSQLATGGELRNIQIPEINARYIKVTELSAKRKYGSLSELKITSAAIVPEDAKSNLYLKVLNNKNQYVKDSQYRLTQDHDLIEKGKTESKEIIFSKLENKDHSLTIICPKKQTNSFTSFFVPFISLFSKPKITGKVSDGYGTITEILENTTIQGDKCLNSQLLKPTIASSDKTLKGYPTSLSFDENLSTSWYGDNKKGYPYSILFDLDAITCVEGIEISIPKSATPVELVLETSILDNLPFTKISSYTVSSSSSTLFQFNATKARFVKITENSGANLYGGISEIRILASPVVRGEPQGLFKEEPSSLAKLPKYSSLFLSIEDETGKPLSSVKVNLETSQDNSDSKTDKNGKVTLENAITSESHVSVICP